MEQLQQRMSESEEGGLHESMTATETWSVKLHSNSNHWTLYVRKHYNSLGYTDAIWQHRSGSTLAQVMACCLVDISHRLHKLMLTYHQGYSVAFTSWMQLPILAITKILFRSIKMASEIFLSSIYFRTLSVNSKAAYWISQVIFFFKSILIIMHRINCYFENNHKAEEWEHIRFTQFSWKWRDFMTIGGIFSQVLTFKNQEIDEMQWRKLFRPSFELLILKSKILFSASKNLVSLWCGVGHGKGNSLMWSWSWQRKFID